MKKADKLRSFFAVFAGAAGAVFLCVLLAFLLGGVSLSLGRAALTLLIALAGGALISAGIIFLAPAAAKEARVAKEEAEKLNEAVLRAQEGDLSLPWEDLEVKLSGKKSRIPFRRVYERLVTVLVESSRMSNRMRKLAEEIRQQADRLTESAERQSEVVGHSTDSISKIDAAVREVVKNLETLSDLADNVSSATFQMLSSIEEVGRNVIELNKAVQEEVSAVEEIAGNIRSVSESTDSLSSAASQTRQSMAEIESATSSIRDRADRAATLSEAAREGSSRTKELLAHAVSGVKSLAESIQQTREQMRSLGEQSRAIGEILDVISSVAGDTHLLSLNASIMAAKAGEHGRGFAVVAQEIKNLAMRTTENAKEIEKIIFNTQETVDKAIHAIEEGARQAREGVRLSEQAESALAEVLSQVEVAAKNAREIAKDTEAQAAVTAQVLRAMDQVADRTEQIRAAMKEQESAGAYLRERAASTQNLMTMVAQAMSEQAEVNRRISQAMDELIGSIQTIRLETEAQGKSSQEVVEAIKAIKKMADSVAIAAQNTSNTSMSVLNQALLLSGELKEMNLPERAPSLTIGVLFDNLREERWRREKEIFQAKAEELGVRLEVRVAEGSHRRQAEQAEELIQRGADLLIIVAVDAEAAAEIVNRARARKVPVIAYDRLIKNCELDLFVSFDAKKIGILQAQTALEHAGGNRILVLAGSPSDVNSHFLYQAQMSVLRPLAEKGEVEIVEEIWVPDWDPEKAYELVKKTIQEKGPVDAVVASNDGTAGGAVRAVSELLPGRKIAVTGMDTELSACRRIVKGEQVMTVYMPIKLQASRAMEAALLMLKNGEIPGITHHIKNNGFSIPAILLKPVKVDAENLEEVVVKDGFHRGEEIYQ